MDSTRVVDRVVTPRVAILANLGLVFTGSILGLLEAVDTVSAAVIVLVGFAGIAVTVYGLRAES